MGIRTGEQYIEAIKKLKPAVWLNGRKIENVYDEPYFRQPINEIAKLYDLQHDPKYQNEITHVCEDTGERTSNGYLIPRNAEDLQSRRRLFEVFAEATFGLMGRSPDFLQTVVTSFYSNNQFFKDYGREKGDMLQQNIINYYKYIRDNDLFLTHAIVNPQNDRSRASHEQKEEFTHLGVVKETEEGLIVSGAKMLATLGPITDEVLVYSYPGFAPGDDKYAIAFAMPADAKGIKMYCREPAQDGTRPVWDHPLASRFEECDALLVFDNVLVPWDRVFINQDWEAGNKLYAATEVNWQPAHQSGVRGYTKLKFVGETIRKVADTIGVDGFLNVQYAISEVLSAVETIRCLLRTSENEFFMSKNGEALPNGNPLQTIRMILPVMYPKAVQILQTNGAGGLLMMPTEADFNNPETKDDIEKYFGGKESIPTQERIQVFKLAWDLCGEAFGQRLAQYERYYSGDPVRKMGVYYMDHKRANPTYPMVERAIAEAQKPLK